MICGFFATVAPDARQSGTQCKHLRCSTLCGKTGPGPPPGGLVDALGRRQHADQGGSQSWSSPLRKVRSDLAGRGRLIWASAHSRDSVSGAAVHHRRSAPPSM
jgi:hypothetical protein